MKTEIAFILDRSGSMESMTHAAISGFNEFLKAQQATLDDQGMTVSVTFGWMASRSESRRSIKRG